MRLLILNCLLLSVLANAKTVVITTVGVRAPLESAQNSAVFHANNEALESLSPNDILDLRWESPGVDQKNTIKTRRFHLGHLLVPGNTTAIWELPDMPGKVLRLPTSWMRKAGFPPRFVPEFISLTMQGYWQLRQKNVPIPEIFESQPHLFIVVERLHGIHLIDFVMQPNRFSPADLKLMTEALKRFAGSFADFDRVSDFRADQVMFDMNRNEWVLFDWAGYHVPAALHASGNPFSNFFRMMLFQVSGTVVEARVHMLSDLLETSLRSEREMRLNLGITATVLGPELPPVGSSVSTVSALKPPTSGCDKIFSR